MNYLVILKDKSAFMTDWYTYENCWSEDCMICVIDNVRDKISFDGKTWKDIEYDEDTNVLEIF